MTNLLLTTALLSGMRVLLGLIFVFSNFHPFGLRNVTCVAVANLQWSKHQQKVDWKSILLLCNYGQWKCMFVGFLTVHTGLPNCIHYKKCETIDKNWRRSLVCLKTCIVMMFVLWSSPNHMTIVKYRCPINKSNRITPAHLNTQNKLWRRDKL